MTFLRNLKGIITFNKQRLYLISLDDHSTIQALIIISTLAVFETFFGIFYAFIYSEKLYEELMIHGIISTFSLFEIIFRDLYTFLYAEEFHIEINISLIISSFLMFYIFVVLFTYILAFFINKLGGEIIPINCFRIIGLSFVFETILAILIEPIRLCTVGTPIPWNLLIFIPLILQFIIISLGIITVSGLTWWKAGISITIAYFFSIILAFIIAGIIIKGIINDLFDYKPGLFVIFFNCLLSNIIRSIFA